MHKKAAAKKRCTLQYSKAHAEQLWNDLAHRFAEKASIGKHLRGVDRILPLLPEATETAEENVPTMLTLDAAAFWSDVRHDADLGDNDHLPVLEAIVLESLVFRLVQANVLTVHRADGRIQ